MLVAAIISIRNPHQGFKSNLPAAAPLVTNSRTTLYRWDHAERRRTSTREGQTRAYYIVWARQPPIRYADPVWYVLHQYTATF